MKNTFTVLIILFTVNISIACSFNPTSFCTTINTENPNNTILRGYFSESMSFGMVFTRLETLRGDEDREQIKIWDNLPFDCNDWHFRLASYLGDLNQEVIISINHIGEDTSYFLDAEPEDYQVPEDFWNETHSLKVIGDSIQGHIFIRPNLATTEESIHYDDFLEALIESPSCAISSTNEKNEQIINIFPTLVIDDLYMEYNSSLKGSTTKIYNSNGHLVLSKKTSPISHLGLLENGMYIVVIQTIENKCYHQKIVKI